MTFISTTIFAAIIAVVGTLVAIYWGQIKRYCSLLKLTVMQKQRELRFAALLLTGATLLFLGGWWCGKPAKAVPSHATQVVYIDPTTTNSYVWATVQIDDDNVQHLNMELIQAHNFDEALAIMLLHDNRRGYKHPRLQMSYGIQTK